MPLVVCESARDFFTVGSYFSSSSMFERAFHIISMGASMMISLYNVVIVFYFSVSDFRLFNILSWAFEIIFFSITPFMIFAKILAGRYRVSLITLVLVSLIFSRLRQNRVSLSI